MKKSLKNIALTILLAGNSSILSSLPALSKAIPSVTGALARAVRNKPKINATVGNAKPKSFKPFVPSTIVPEVPTSLPPSFQTLVQATPVPKQMQLRHAHFFSTSTPKEAASLNEIRGIRALEQNRQEANQYVNPIKGIIKELKEIATNAHEAAGKKYINNKPTVKVKLDALKKADQESATILEQAQAAAKKGNIQQSQKYLQQIQETLARVQEDATSIKKAKPSFWNKLLHHTKRKKETIIGSGKKALDNGKQTIANTSTALTARTKATLSPVHQAMSKIVNTIQKSAKYAGEAPSRIKATWTRDEFSAAWFLNEKNNNPFTLLGVQGLRTRITPENPFLVYSRLEASYHRLAKIWHPDSHKHPDASKVMEKINKAYGQAKKQLEQKYNKALKEFEDKLHAQHQRNVDGLNDEIGTLQKEIKSNQGDEKLVAELGQKLKNTENVLKKKIHDYKNALPEFKKEAAQKAIQEYEQQLQRQKIGYKIKETWKDIKKDPKATFEKLLQETKSLGWKYLVKPTAKTLAKYVGTPLVLFKGAEYAWDHHQPVVFFDQKLIRIDDKIEQKQEELTELQELFYTSEPEERETLEHTIALTQAALDGLELEKRDLLLKKTKKIQRQNSAKEKVLSKSEKEEEEQAESQPLPTVYNEDHTTNTQIKELQKQIDTLLQQQGKSQEEKQEDKKLIKQLQEQLQQLENTIAQQEQELSELNNKEKNEEQVVQPTIHENTPDDTGSQTNNLPKKDTVIAPVTKQPEATFNPVKWATGLGVALVAAKLVSPLLKNTRTKTDSHQEESDVKDKVETQHKVPSENNEIVSEVEAALDELEAGLDSKKETSSNKETPDQDTTVECDEDILNALKKAGEHDINTLDSIQSTLLNTVKQRLDAGTVWELWQMGDFKEFYRLYLQRYFTKLLKPYVQASEDKTAISGQLAKLLESIIQQVTHLVESN